MQPWGGYIRYLIRERHWPSRLQRLFMQGDPTGEVQATADAIIRQMKAEDEQ